MAEPAVPESRFSLLFASLVLLVVVYPPVEAWFPELRLNLIFRLAVLAGALRAITHHRRVRWAMALLALAPLPGAVLPELGPDWLPIASLACELLFYASMITLLTLSVFHRPGVNRQTLYGAASTFLLIALAFGIVYQLAEVTAPGSFQLPVWVSEASLERTLFYFSFVTLTTLGYGDITPVSDAMRSLVVIESITGILFPAIMISRVVGLYTSGGQESGAGASGKNELPFERSSLLPSGRSPAPYLEVLFLAQVIQIASYPYVPMAVTRIVEIGILLAALLALRARPVYLVAGLALAIPAVLSWGSLAETLGSAFLTFFLIFAAVALAAHLSRQREVGREVVFGICCVYLLIGAAFASAYQLVFALDPASLSLPPLASPAEAFASTLYLSYVTLTTLGYGDILPLNGVAQSLATIEAVIGVLFPALVIARLVSLYHATPAIGPTTASQSPVATEPTDRG